MEVGKIGCRIIEEIGVKGLKDKKVCLHFSLIEITRKCNLKCKHCLRGEAENTTITKEMIDNFFDNIDGILILNFTGGEPLLALDEIEYAIDKIIRDKINVGGLVVITNGTILDKRVADIFNKYNKYLHENMSYFFEDGKNTRVELLISNSEFHNNQPEKAVEFYRSILDEDIPVGFRNVESGVMDGLVNSGRAVNIPDSEYKKSDVPTGQHRIFYAEDGTPDDIKKYTEHTGNNIIAKNMVFPCIQLNANGNVVLSRPCTFIEEDKEENVICNMKEKVNLAEAIDKWNDTHLLTRREAFLLDEFYKKAETSGKISEEIKDSVDKHIELLNQARKKAVEVFPYLDFRERALLSYATLKLGLEEKYILEYIIDDNKLTMEECQNVIDNMTRYNQERAIENKDYRFGFPEGYFLNKFLNWLGSGSKKDEK